MALREQVVSGSSTREDFALVRSKVALLIIDVQKYVSTPQSDQEAKEHSYLFNEALPRAIGNIHSLTDAFREARDSSSATAGCEVIFVYLQSATNDGRDISLDYKLSGPRLANIPTCTATPEDIFFSDLKPNQKRGKGDIVVPKTSCSVFISTNLDFTLRNLGIEQIVMTGQLTDQCVESAVRDAADLGYLVSLCEDCCAATSVENHQKGIHGATGLARIVTTEQVLEELAAETKVEEKGAASSVAGDVTDEQVMRYLEHRGLDNALYELEQHLHEPSDAESNGADHAKENGESQNNGNNNNNSHGDMGLATVAEEDDGPSAASSVANEESESHPEEEDAGEGTFFEKEAVVVENGEKETPVSAEEKEGMGDTSAHSEEQPKETASLPDENENEMEEEAESSAPSEPAQTANTKSALSAWAKSINKKYTERPEEEEEEEPTAAPLSSFLSTPPDNTVENAEEDSIEAFSQSEEEEPDSPSTSRYTGGRGMLSPSDELDDIGGSAILDTVIEGDREETETSVQPEPVEIKEATAPGNLLSPEEEEDMTGGSREVDIMDEAQMMAQPETDNEKDEMQDETEEEGHEEDETEPSEAQDEVDALPDENEEAQDEVDALPDENEETDKSPDENEEDTSPAETQGEAEEEEEEEEAQQQQPKGKKKGFFGRFSRRNTKEENGAGQVDELAPAESINEASENEPTSEQGEAVEGSVEPITAAEEQEAQPKKKRGFFGRSKKGSQADESPVESLNESSENGPTSEKADTTDGANEEPVTPAEQETPKKKRGFFGRGKKEDKGAASEQTPEEQDAPDQADEETQQNTTADLADVATGADELPGDKQKEKKRGFFGFGRKNKKEDGEVPTEDTAASRDSTAEEEKTEIKDAPRPNTEDLAVEAQESLSMDTNDEPPKKSVPAAEKEEKTTEETEPPPKERSTPQEESKPEAGVPSEVAVEGDEAGLSGSGHKEKKKSSKKSKSGEKSRKTPKRSKSKENDELIGVDLEKESKPKKSSDHDRSDPEGDMEKQNSFKKSKKKKSSATGDGANGELHDSSTSLEKARKKKGGDFNDSATSLEKAKKKKSKRGSAGGGAGEHRKSSKSKKESKKKREEAEEAA